jgi:hypothetical protein
MRLFWLISVMANAAVPIDSSFPNCGEVDRPDLCPADLDEEWWLLSYVPEHSRESVRADELELGSGVSVIPGFNGKTNTW